MGNRKIVAGWELCASSWSRISTRSMKTKIFLIVAVSVFFFAGSVKADSSFSKNLYFGMQKDSEVTKLQEFLTSEGIYSGPITGNFFSLTLKAVKDFQTRESISPAAGFFGPLTRTRANQTLGAQVQALESQAVAETGTTTPSITPPKTTNDVVASLQAQIDLLMKQLALAQQQASSVIAIQQAAQQTQVTLQQIQQNTAQIPAPTLVFNLSSYLKRPDAHWFYLSWSSTNAYSCWASGSWSGAQPINGNNVFAEIGLYSQSATFTLICSGASGSVSKSVSWNAPPSSPIVIPPSTSTPPTPTPPTPTPPPQPGNLIVSLVSGNNASPSEDGITVPNMANTPYLAFKLTSQNEPLKVTFLKITAEGTGVSSLRNIRFYEGSIPTLFAQIPKFNSCSTNSCSITLTDPDNLLPELVPTTGVTIYVKADIAPGGSAILGSSFIFGLASVDDIQIKGAITSSTVGIKSGLPIIAHGITHIVSQQVIISGVSPSGGIYGGAAAGTSVAIFRITNNGSSAIYIDPSSLSFKNGGAATTSLSFKIYASAMNSGAGDISAWNNGVGYLAAAGTTGASSTVSFSGIALTSSEAKIDGGSVRYLTIKTTANAANNDTCQFSINALGEILYYVQEVDLGYSGNNDLDLTDTIYGLKVDGTPTLGGYYLRT